jgi:hypothetical protein
MSNLTIEPIGRMRVTVPRGSDSGVIVTVDGAPESIVTDIDFGPIIDLGIAIGKKILAGDGGSGGSGSGGGGKGCMSMSFTAPDGSTFSGTFCPPHAVS